jgi:hypothetical protein
VRYVFEHRYGSSRDGRRYGPWSAGHIEELDPTEAEWINRDSPGACAPEVAEPTMEAPVVPEPVEVLETVEAEVAVEPVAPTEPELVAEAEPAGEPRREAHPTRDRMNRGARNRTP